MYADSTWVPAYPIPETSVSTSLRTLTLAVKREPATLTNLPTEVRMEILRNLLVMPDQQPLASNGVVNTPVTRIRLSGGATLEVQQWTRRQLQDTIDQRTTGLPQSQCHDCAHLDPPTSNKLHTSISLTNRRLHFEAMSATFENHFICLTATHDLSTDPNFLGLLQHFRLSPSGHVNGGPPHDILPLMTIYLALPNPEHIVPLASPTYMFPWRCLWSLRRVLMHLTHIYSNSKISIELHRGSVKGLYESPTLMRELVMDPLWPYIHGQIRQFRWADINHTKTDCTCIIKTIADANFATRKKAMKLGPGSRWTPDFCIQVWEEQVRWLRQIAQRGVLSPATKAADVVYSELGWEVLPHRLLHDIADTLELYEAGFITTFMPHVARLYFIRRMRAETHYYVALIHLNEAHVSSTDSGERELAKRTSEESTLEALTNLHLGRNMIDDGFSDHLVHRLHFEILTFEADVRLDLYGWAQAKVVLENLCPAHLLRDKPEQILSDDDQARIKREWADDVVKTMSVEMSRLRTMRSEKIRLDTAKEPSCPKGERSIVKKMNICDWEAKVARGLVCKVLLPEMSRHFAAEESLIDLELLRVPTLSELGIGET